MTPLTFLGGAFYQPYAPSLGVSSSVSRISRISGIIKRMPTAKHPARAASPRSQRSPLSGHGGSTSVTWDSAARPKAKAARGSRVKTAFLRFELSPLLDVIRRHTHLTPAATNKLRRDLAKLITQPVQLSFAQEPKGAKAAVIAQPPDEVIGTQAAADLVGVSRPYLARMVDSGAIPLHHKVGDQRRVLRSDVLAWHQRERAAQRRALGQLMDDVDDEIFS